MTATTRRSSHAIGSRIEKAGPRDHSRGLPFVRGTSAAPRASRGRARGRNRMPEQRTHVAKEVLADRLLAEANPVVRNAIGATSVTRCYNGFWRSNLSSLFFVQRGRLESLPDTETIALNLIDFMLIDRHWDRRLQLNILAASCFLFASSLTGLGNQADDIVRSFGLDLDLHTSGWMTSVISRGIPVTDAAAMKSSLRLTTEDIENGYAILWNMRRGFSELVGDYAEELEVMSMPRGYFEMTEQRMPEEMEREEAAQVPEEQDSLQAEVEHTEELAESDPSLVVRCDPGMPGQSVSMASLGESQSMERMPLEPEVVELDDFEAAIEEYESWAGVVLRHGFSTG